MEVKYISNYGKIMARNNFPKGFDIDSKFHGKQRQFKVTTALLATPKPIKDRKKLKEKDYVAIIKQAQDDIASKDNTKRPPSACFKSQSRIDFYNKSQSRDNIPPCGTYNVKYSLREHRPKSPNFSVKHKTVARIKQKRRSDSFNTGEPMKSKRSLVSFDKQSSRPINRNTTGAHEARFIVIPNTKHKNRRVSTPDFNSYSQRTRNLFNTKQDNWPIYYPDTSSTKEKQAKGYVNMDKQVARQSKREPAANDLIYTNINYDAVEKRVKSPTLDRPKSNSPRRSEHELPMFMLNLDNRMGLEAMQEKSLEMSRYKEHSLTDVQDQFQQPTYESPVNERAYLYSASMTPEPILRSVLAYKI